MTQCDAPIQTDRTEILPLPPPIEHAASVPSGPEPLSDLWFSELVTAEHGDDLKYVSAWKRWFVWNAEHGCWHADETGEVIRRIASVAKSVLRIEVARIVGENDASVRTLRRFQSKRTIEDVERLLRSNSAIARDTKIWDKRPGLLVVGNGTLDLRTGELHESSRDDFITHRSAIAYRLDAECPIFLRFLDRVVPDKEVRDYLRVAIGYALLGYSTEHVVHFFWGSGANGKSTFLDVIRYVAGDFAATAPPRLLIAHKSEPHPTGLTVLRGRRFICSNETPENGRLDEDLVKMLSGGDVISARGMKQDFYEFEPTHSLFVATNHRPRIVGTDHSIWRRIRLIPFTEQIPENERDPNLKEKLKQEAPGILRWIAEGAREYVANGLRAPDFVLAATTEYRESEDVLGEYIEERVCSVAGVLLTISDLFADYQAWCSDNGIPESRRLAKNQLSSKLTDRQWIPKKTAKSRGFADRALRARVEGVP